MLEETNGTSQSVWMDVETPDFPPLQADIETDVCVIGAGIAGLTSAYLLARSGKRVVLLEAWSVGAGETGRTTAHFFPPDEWYDDIQASFGTAGARLVAEAFAKATDLVEAIVREERIACGFERLDGYLYALPGNRFRALRREYEVARRAGVAVDYLERVPDLSFDTGPCVRYRRQAQFHPLKYLNGLARGLLARGGQIYCHSRAIDVSGDEDFQVVSTDHGRVRAKAAVIATNTPFNNRVVMHTKQAAYRTYVVAMRVPRGSVPRILLWDTGDPYYYVRLESPAGDAGHDLLIVGGADHKGGQDIHPEHRYGEIERWAREHFPMAGEVDYRWSGTVMEPADGLAYLGRNPLDERNVFIITGDSGNGMTHCTIGAMVVKDLIAGLGNRWAGLYDPARKPVHGDGAREFFSEQANTLAQYGDWLVGGEVDSALEIAPGQGAIVKDGLGKRAVFRDADGELHALSAKCTHLGCVVHWNSAEQSWDCPCHGSRFDVHGEVLHGPAATALPAVTLDPGQGVPTGTAGEHPSGHPPSGH